MRNLRFTVLLVLILLTLNSCKTAQGNIAENTNGWESIFNGKNLDGWTPKIAGFEVGDNYMNTFKVEDGMITVNYDGYNEFGDRFGHLFYKNELSHYKLRLKYRFIGSQIEGGQGWA